MNETIKYIAGLLNVKTDSDLVIADMAIEIGKVKDMSAYRTYLRDNFRKIEFATGFQKFITLTNDFLNIEEDKALAGYYSKAEESAKALAGKVKQTRRTVEDNFCDFSNIKLDGDDFFTEKEIKALQEIGTTITIIDLSKAHSLAGELYKNYVKFLRGGIQPQLTSGQTKVKKLLGGVG